MSATVHNIRPRTHQRTIARRRHGDATTMAPLIDAGHDALNRLQLISTVRAATIGRGLTLWADRDATRCALLATAEHRATLDLTRVDRSDPEQAGMAALIDADADLIPAIVAGLTPRMGAEVRARAWDQLVDAVTHHTDLRMHEAAGTVPRYLHCGGLSVQQALLADTVDSEGRITDALAVLAVYAYRNDDGPGAA
jgi:hypothetical protein